MDHEQTGEETNTKHQQQKPEFPPLILINSIWEKKINTVCTHHNIDINHLHTLEKQQQRAELKKGMQTSRTQMLLKDNQNKSKTKIIMLHRDASNIMCQPKYMTTLNRKQCSAIFKYKSRMLNVFGKLPRQL